jgi:hypothetical protein
MCTKSNHKSLSQTCHLELISEEEQSELVAEIQSLSVKADMDRAEKKKLKSTKNDHKKKDLDDRDDDNNDDGDWDIRLLLTRAPGWCY